ncbi:helix-turn-helix domain-containing protein [Streptomyces mexicanus]|uniref:helix-turn-helix domain-containing protein n=1 Tax=Streptomyces mexicanus TaxID=178566 RepID=UPI003664AC6E
MTPLERPRPPERPQPPEQARLTAALRELRQRTGLSLAALAQHTTYSKSSWERYLNGKTLPPRRAVEDLCRLAREPAGRCLALWEIAESQWSGRAAGAPAAGTSSGRIADTAAGASSGTPATPSPGTSSDAAAGVPPPASAPPRKARWFGRKGGVALAVLVSVCAVAVGSLTAALVLLPRRDAPPRSSLSAPPPATGPRCRAATCEGRNPMQLGCALGLVTLASYRTATGARMELRYHDGCRAGWARMWHTRIGDRLAVTAGGPTRSATVRDGLDAASYVYTPMTAARPGTVLRACFRPADGGGTECFTGRVRPAPAHTPPTAG